MDINIDNHSGRTMYGNYLRYNMVYIVQRLLGHNPGKPFFKRARRK